MEERLRKFAVLIEAGSYTAAAQRLHVSQPALTAAVQKLERELKTELVVRHQRPLRPTRTGTLALRTAQQQALHMSNFQTQLLELSGLKPNIAIGMIDSLADMVFGQHDGLEQLNQAAHVSLHINNSAQLLSSVARHDIDVAFTVAQDNPSTLLAYTYVGSEPLVLVCHAQEELAAKTLLKKGILLNFLSYNQGSTTEQLIQAHLMRHNIVVQPSFYSTSPAVMLQLIRTQRGIAILPYSLVAASISQKRLVILAELPPLFRKIVMVRFLNKQLPPAIDTLCTQLQTLLNRLRDSTT